MRPETAGCRGPAAPQARVARRRPTRAQAARPAHEPAGRPATAAPGVAEPDTSPATCSSASAPASRSRIRERQAIERSWPGTPAIPSISSARSAAPSSTCTTSSPRSSARGMPLELALLPVIESAFEPYAYSRARASGLWQFIPGTGTRFGLHAELVVRRPPRRARVDPRRARLPAVPARRIQRRLAAGDRRLQLRRGLRRPRGARATGRPAGRSTSGTCGCRPRRAPTCRSCWR